MDKLVENLIADWREDYRHRLHQILIDFGLEPSSEKDEALISRQEAKLRDILEHGLDIGTIVKHVIPVTLEWREAHGWVFVATNGRMFRLADYLR